MRFAVKIFISAKIQQLKQIQGITDFNLLDKAKLDIMMKKTLAFVIILAYDEIVLKKNPPFERFMKESMLGSE